MWAGPLTVLLVTAAPAWAQTGAPANPPAAAASAPVPTVQVQTFEVLGNTLLAAEAVQGRLAEFKGTATLQRLRDAAAAVQELYRRAGYGGVVAFLPEQTMAGGLVRIRVIEGKLTRVDVADNKQYSVANIRASLPTLVTGATPQVRRIDAEIQLANENPAKSVQVLLQPGDTAGSIAAKVTVAEQPVQRFTARVDNTGGERTGRWRAALGWMHANVADKDHVFAVELQTAPEDTQAVAVLSASYRAPLYGQAMAIDAYGAYSDVDAGKVGTAAGDLAFSGQGYIVGTRLNAYLPRYFNLDQRLIAGLEWREYLNNCAIDGLPQGACGAAGESVSVQPLSLSYTAQTVSEIRAGFSVGLHHNLAFGGRHGEQADFEAVRANSVRRYTLLRASAQLAVPVSEWGQLAARVQGQLSAKPLVPGELFGIGGAQSVRGFEERELGGDSGVQVSLEALSPNLGESLLQQPGLDLRALLFADAGFVSNQQGDPCLLDRSDCRMGSLGLGLRANWQQWQLRLDIARAMSTGTTTQKGDVRAHFGLSTAF
ncbi:MAG: ShlB/FhaC/HecB family hemolysin secretion/activation protein [Rubrivivax sp.]|nr:ShlB/FhaC/HecB family hemolysin secretion/activation protein [Rubrivivax sp.]